MDITTIFGDSLPERPTAEPKRFRILVLGDFGANVDWTTPQAVDRDDLDDVFRRLGVCVRIAGDTTLPDLEIPLRELDDFHPDRLYEQMELFEALRTRRRRLQNDKTFAEEAEAILTSREESSEASPEEPAVKPNAGEEPPAAQLDPADLLGQALEQTESTIGKNRGPVVERIAEGRLNIDDYVRQVVEPYVLNKSDPRKAEFVAGVDEAIAATMRNVLHHPTFQQLESAWMGVRMLVRRLETDRTLKISLVNVSKSTLAQDVLENDNLAATRLHELLTPTDESGEDPWAVVIGDFTFDSTQEDSSLLGRVAKIHAAVGSVFLSGASPSIVGCEDLMTSSDPQEWSVDDEAASHWDALRRLPEAANVALALPRVIARIPYGQSTDPIDAFRFEEIPNADVHDNYLWINAAFAVATLLGQSFSRNGWALSAAWSPELNDLPTCIYDDDGESAMKPCAETELPSAAVTAFFEAGLTLIRSVRNQGSVLIPSLRSLSRGETAVAGRWE